MSKSWRETTIASVIWNFIVTAGLGSFVLIAGSLQAIILRKWPWRGDIIPAGFWTRKTWARLLLWFYRVDIKIEGPGAKDFEKLHGTVIVANHQSALDILALAKAIPFPFAFFSKKELLMIPVFGWAAWLSGVVYVDRKKGVQHDSAMGAVKNILRRGGAVAVFPEGTRSTDGKLLPFKRGAFVMALDAQASILPVVIQGPRDLLPKHQLCVRSGTIRLWVGELISTKGLGTEARFELCEKARSIISNRLDLAA